MQKQKSRSKMRDSRMFEVPNYAQMTEFTSAAACIMMALKFLNKGAKMDEGTQTAIWQEAVNGSVWHGSRYGVAFALAKRGARTAIFTNAKDEGYERKIAVDQDVNLSALSSSFNEIREKTRQMRIKETKAPTTINLIKKQLTSGKIPIVLVNAKNLDPYRDYSPHWVLIKGYDKDTVYINDPYSNTTLTMEPQVFKSALGFDNEYHMITVDARK